MLKVFIDCDVILDLFTKRKKFYLAAGEVFTLIDLGKIKGYTSPLVFSNIHYLCQKYKNKNFANNCIKKLESFLSILDINKKIVNLAITSDFTDFEDSLQYYTALEGNMNYIITRNIKDYKKKELPAITPLDFKNLFIASTTKDVIG